MSKVISRDDAKLLEKWAASTTQDQHSLASARALTAREIEELQLQAQKEGHAEGYKQGLVDGANEIKNRVSRLQLVFTTLQRPLEELDARVEEELVVLALAIARQIIRRELKSDPSHVMAAVREGLSILPLASRNVRILLHPDDAQVVKNSLSLSEAEQGWKIVDDPTVTRGGCRVITETAQIDATLEKRLALIAAQLLGGERESDQ
ncbi:MAG: flagellar assembly protein FliH [Halothiobacillaceae bacterium]|nr:MAG: flagellar assembly protein FliH [Halothiobacillaceae bacterium]